MNVCEVCKRQLKLVWNFCPWCGLKLIKGLVVLEKKFVVGDKQ